MNDQLALFEPAGVELGQLVARAVRESEREHLAADHLLLCGYPGAALVHDRAFIFARDKAVIFETALQFERLAGLV